MDFVGALLFTIRAGGNKKMNRPWIGAPLFGKTRYRFYWARRDSHFSVVWACIPFPVLRRAEDLRRHIYRQPRG